MQTRLILDQAIADGLDIIGDKWTILILRSAFLGARRFEALQAATGASRSTLTRRLQALVEHDIFYKHPYRQSTRRFEYKFTEKGLGLLGPSLLAAQWESDWQTTGYVDMSSRLFHQHCSNTMTPKVVCKACKQAVLFDDVIWPDLEQQLGAQLQEIRTYNTQHRKRISTDEGRKSNANLASLIGDRWTLLILISAFFGTQRYDDFLNRLSIPPSVLAERLKQLVTNKILAKEAYQQNPPRHDYKLTRKGQDLFPFVMTLRQWVAPHNSTPLKHASCGQALIFDVVCDQCDHRPWPSDLQLVAE